MARWTAPSADDYFDAVEARHTYAREEKPNTVQAVCRSCGGWFEHDPARPELLCRACVALHDLTALLHKDQGAA